MINWIKAAQALLIILGAVIVASSVVRSMQNISGIYIEVMSIIVGIISSFIASSVFIKITSTLEKSREYKKLSIVGIFLKKQARFSYILSLCLVISSFIYIIFQMLLDRNIEFGVIIAIFVMSSLAIARQWLLQYRVRKGLYGTDEEDAREIIGFILRHAGDIGGDGPGQERRPFITPADLEEILHAAPASGIPGKVAFH